MNYQLSEVTLIIIVGTLLLMAMGAFVTALLFFYKRKYQAHQAEVALLHETHRREMLTAQLETQNQTLQRVADDLHDHVGQMLSVVWLHLNRLHDETRHLPAQETVGELLTYTSVLVTDVRSLSKTLSTDTIARFGLRACLDLEIERINRVGAAQRASLTVLGETYSLGQQTEIILLRMAQEALNNALKHAPSAPISLLLDYHPTELVMTVADEGPGFLLDDVEARSIDGAGQGMHNLRRRAALLGGTCTWQSALEQGTCVSMNIPRPDDGLAPKPLGTTKTGKRGQPA